MFASSDELPYFHIHSLIASPTSAYSLSLVTPVEVVQELRRTARRIYDKEIPLVGIRLLLTNPKALEKYGEDFSPEDYTDMFTLTRLGSDILLEMGYLESREDMLKVREEITVWDDETSTTLELFFDPTNYVAKPSPFTDVWRNVMRSPVIPFDFDSRKEQFKVAYEELSEYITLWSDPLPGTWRHERLRRNY